MCYLSLSFPLSTYIYTLKLLVTTGWFFSENIRLHIIHAFISHSMYNMAIRYIICDMRQSSKHDSGVGLNWELMFSNMLEHFRVDIISLQIVGFIGNLLTHTYTHIHTHTQIVHMHMSSTCVYVWILNRQSSRSDSRIGSWGFRAGTVF
jgi:hypothetical protein